MTDLKKKLLKKTAVFGLIIGTGYLIVLDYNMPPAHDTDAARDDLAFKEWRYDEAHRIAIEQSADTLSKDTNYIKLMDKKEKVRKTIDSVFFGSDLSPDVYTQHEKLSEKADSLENELRSAHINKNKELIIATDMYLEADERLRKAQRDSVVRDSIRQIPVGKRLKTNWKQMRLDYHNFCADVHNKCIKSIQKTK